MADVCSTPNDHTIISSTAAVAAESATGELEKNEDSVLSGGCSLEKQKQDEKNEVPEPIASKKQKKMERAFCEWEHQGEPVFLTLKGLLELSQKRYYGLKDDEKLDYELWGKYRTQIAESEGFDIKDFPRPCYMRDFYPIDDIGSDSRSHQLAELALEQFVKENGKGELYELDKVTKVNGSRIFGVMHYITFQARKSGTGADPDDSLVTFQARVWDCRDPENFGVKLCRIKPSA